MIQVVDEYTKVPSLCTQSSILKDVISMLLCGATTVLLYHEIMLLLYDVFCMIGSAHIALNGTSAGGMNVASFSTMSGAVHGSNHVRFHSLTLCYRRGIH